MTFSLQINSTVTDKVLLLNKINETKWVTWTTPILLCGGIRDVLIQIESLEKLYDLAQELQCNITILNRSYPTIEISTNNDV